MHYVCVACGQCRQAGECLEYPEVTQVLEKIQAADGLVLATPTWWLGPSSYPKIFIGHGGAFLRPDYSSRIAGKMALILSCCGSSEVNLVEKVCVDLKQILDFHGVEVKGMLGVKGVAEIGAVNREYTALNDAFALGSFFYSE